MQVDYYGGPGERPNLPKSVSFTSLGGNASPFEDLTFGALTGRMRALESPWFAVGATIDGEPVGLALGFREKEWALLSSLVVRLAYRGCGLGRELLRHWEQEAYGLGVSLLAVRFTEALPNRAALERVLDAQQWTPAGVVLYKLVGYAGRMGRHGGDWLGVRQRILRNHALSYPPFELTPGDEESVTRLLAQPEARHFRDPRSFASTMLPQISVAMRRHGELVGWIIAVPAHPKAARNLGFPNSVVVDYQECYLEPTLWSSGVALGAFYHCFLTQAALYGEDSIAMYQTHPGVPKMVAFTRRRFAPMAITCAAVLSRQKRIRDEA